MVVMVLVEVEKGMQVTKLSLSRAGTKADHGICQGVLSPLHNARALCRPMP